MSRDSNKFIDRDYSEKRDDSISDEHTEKKSRIHSGGVDIVHDNVNALLANPLAGIPQDQLMLDGENFARQYGLAHLTDEFRKGAVLAQDPLAFEHIDILTSEEKNALRREQTHRWDQPFQLYWLVVMCSVAAAVQGVRLLLLPFLR